MTQPETAKQEGKAMGEYAIYQGQQVKIGTCESMIYLRAGQAGLVSKAPNSLDLARHGDKVLYRFPWPDEDGTAPGGYEDSFRSLPLLGATVPDAVTHYRGHAPAGAALVMQRWLDGRLVIVCRCETCDAHYRLPEIADAADALEALAGMAELARYYGHDAAARLYLEIAHRAMAGYDGEIIGS